MTKRDVVVDALMFRRPAYVPWSWHPTHDCATQLRAHLKTDDLSEFLDHHLASTGGRIGFSRTLSATSHVDPYGVTWDTSVDKDIGTPSDWPIKTPQDLRSYVFPDASADACYAHIPDFLKDSRGKFASYGIGFSLFERAWTMRGMENLLMDMVERPEWVEQYLDAIVAHNLQQVHRAVKMGFDCVYFGDDYGMQQGLIMGIDHWRHFIKPRLKRMFAPVREAGLFVYMHSCGQVDPLFEDLVEIGLNVFNPFQPEVMDVFALLPRYRGRLAFHGGMSVQNVLPFGTVKEVRDMAEKLIAAGRDGGYIFAPSHGVPRDVPPENLVAMVDVLKSQKSYGKR